MVEAGKGVVNVLVIEPCAQLAAVGRGLLPRNDRLLAQLGIGELGLQLADILVLLGERVFDLLTLVPQPRQCLGHARFRVERPLGEVVAALRDGKLGAALPFLFVALERGDTALDLLLLSDSAYRRGAHLDKRVLHFLDDEPDDLLGILGAVEDRVDVGVHDVR